MPARSAVSRLAAPVPAPTAFQRQCLCYFLYPGPAPRKPTSLSRAPPPISPRRPRGDVVPGARRPFHGSPARPDDAIDNARNHYETLKVAPGASAADIKKSFYNLSKTHHPDLHEASARRAAARRFMRISEAYSILSSPTKRAKYDREHMNLHHHHHHHHHHHGDSHGGSSSSDKKGSYSSTGPAGGRPASGLSRRRGTFQGPPPSFFRSGGWGSQGEKRRAAHEESTGGGGGGGGGSSSSYSATGTMGGMGPGQDPFGHRDDVPHFDKEGHQRTGRHVDRRREARRAAAAAEGDVVFDDNDDDDDTHQGQRGRGRRRVVVVRRPETGVAGMFFVIGGVLLLSFVAPFFIGRLWLGSAQKPEGKEKKK